MPNAVFEDIVIAVREMTRAHMGRPPVSTTPCAILITKEFMTAKGEPKSKYGRDCE
jgi:hypothetical protein